MKWHQPNRIHRSEQTGKLKRETPHTFTNITSHDIVEPLLLQSPSTNRRRISPKRVSPTLQPALPQLYKPTHANSQPIERRRERRLTHIEEATLVNLEQASIKSQLIVRRQKTVIYHPDKVYEKLPLTTQNSAQLVQIGGSYIQLTKPSQPTSFFASRKNVKSYLKHNPRQHSKSKNEAEEDKRVLAKKGRKELRSYMEFIGSVSKEYVFVANYAELRSLKKKQVAERFDLQTAYAIENILMLTYEALVKHSTNEKDKQASMKETLQEYCKFYFMLQTKSEIETLIGWSILQAFQRQLRQLFVCQRLAMLSLYILNSEGALDKISQPPEVNGTLQSLTRIFFDLHISYATILQIVLATIDKGQKPSHINHTFKLLKGMCEVEKLATGASSTLKELIKSIGSPSLYQADHQLVGLLEKAQQDSRFEEVLFRYESVLRWRYARIPPVPYLPPLQQGKQYTLVLDLEQTLVYYHQKSEMLKFRPHLQAFLQATSKDFEIVLFTASNKDYVDRILKEVDPKAEHIHYRLYREHMRFSGKGPLKDLTKLGRNLSKVIFMDNVPSNFRNCAENGMKISTWEGERNDLSLQHILPILRLIVDNDLEDVRQVIRSHQLGVTLADMNTTEEDFHPH